MARFAKMSVLCDEKDFPDYKYECAFNWPENCSIQGGDKGVVFVEGGESYRTAFFEAFPKVPNTFIRGEGKSVQEAEKNAWEKYQRALSCPEHEFERRGYRNGVGFCKHCNMSSSKAFEPAETCYRCGANTYYLQDKHGKWACENCHKSVAWDDLTDVGKMCRDGVRYSWEKYPEDHTHCELDKGHEGECGTPDYMGEWVGPDREMCGKPLPSYEERYG